MLVVLFLRSLFYPKLVSVLQVVILYSVFLRFTEDRESGAVIEITAIEMQSWLQDCCCHSCIHTAQ